MCDFEICWDSEKCIAASGKKIISNLRPEIGKVRPVVVVHAHKRCKLAMVIPFTTQVPTKEANYTVHIPSGVLPGLLAKKGCWALCDMVQVVNLDRLENVFSGSKIKNKRLVTAPDSRLDPMYFKQINAILRGMF